MTKEEYDKYFQSEEYSRRMKLIKKGAENAKIKAAQKKRYIEAKQRWNRRREISDTFGI